VEYRGATLDSRTKRIRFAQITYDGFRLQVGDGWETPGEHSYFVSTFNEQLGDMPAQEAGSSGDKEGPQA
jgi:hypothetical protein